MCSRLLVLLLLTAICAPIYSQQRPAAANPTAPQGQDETIRVGTTVVQMDVIVTDKTGRRIKNLTATDFQVLDEGAPQVVDYFTAIEGSSAVRADNRTATSSPASGTDQNKPAVPVTSLATPYQGRHIALVFDDLSLSAENFLRARRALAEYVTTKLTQNDMMALISTGGALSSLQQFTNDKQRVLSALNRIGAQSNLYEKIGRTRFNMTAAEAVRIDSGDTVALENVKRRVAAEEPDAPSGTIADQTRTESARDTLRTDALDSQLRTTARAIVNQLTQVTRNNLKTLGNLFRSMADLPGRKIVVLLTESLIIAGGTTGDVSNELIQLIEQARRSGVSVYALDAAGLRAGNVTASQRVTASTLQLRSTNPDLSFSDFENLGAARALVAGTGGELITNTNDLAIGLDRAVEDSSSYYVLGFKPTTPLDNKFHRLTVTVKGKPDLVVRTRRGYLAVNQETVRGTDTELAAALISPVPRLDLPLEVVVNVLPKGAEQVLNAGLHVGRNYLTLPAATATDKKAIYEVVAWVFAAGRDQPVYVIDRAITYDLTVAQAQQKLKTEGVLYVDPITPLPPGLYQMRAVIREKTTGAIGSSYQFFEVPDTRNSKVVSLSSLLLTATGQDKFNGYYSFKAASEMDLRYVIYNLPKETTGLVQRVKLTDAQGRVLMDSELPLAAGVGQAQSPQGTRLNVPKARGRYALVVSLRDAKGKIDIERRADFVVE